jgi:hypothetical protein
VEAGKSRSNFRRKTMRKKNIDVFALESLALVVLLGMACRALAQDAATTYTKMAPIDQYLMADRDAEIALARTAAPESIAGDAGVMVLGRHGFETAVNSKNGFVCIVGRGWTSAADPDFWNPKVRVPLCVNAPAARSYLVRVTKETEWGLAGRTQAQINEAIPGALREGELPPIEPGAMSYMMGKQGYGGDRAPHWPAHVMFYYSDFDPASWGGNLPGSPVLAVADPTEHLTQFVIVVQRWADGTEYHEGSAAEHHH